MESNDEAVIQKKGTKEDLIVPLMIVAFLATAWFVYVYENRAWIVALEQVASWLIKPTITYTPVQVEGIPLAFLATIEVLVLGVLSSKLLFANEKSLAVKLTSALGLGFGLTGLVTIIVGIFGILYQLFLNVAILALCFGFVSIILYRQRGKERPSLNKFFADYFPFKKIRLPVFGFWWLAYIAIGVIFFFCFYSALLTIIVHWDATVYHAVMAVIMYDSHGIPVIAGPSIGIEMSANFPPLFSALGAYYYIQIGAIEDMFLRVIAPIMGLLTIVATYKIGDIVAGKKFGVISALFLAITPMFFRYSMYATSYSTLAFFCTVSIMFLLLGITKKETRYWVAGGLFYGFALLTSYIAFYLAPFFAAALIGYFAWRRGHFGVNLKYALALVLSTLVIASVWYIRNWVLLGDPIYPNAYTIFGGLNIDPLIMETTFNGIRDSGAISLFSGQTTVLEKIFHLSIFRDYFPAFSLFTFLGIALLPFQNKKSWLVSAWPFIVGAIVLSGLTWAFPRHVVFALPGFALLSALPILKALEKCEEYDKRRGYDAPSTLGGIRKRLSHLHASDTLRIALALLLFAAFIFPSLTLSFGGKNSMDNQHDRPTEDYLWLFSHPNGEKWSVIEHIYPEGIGWKWIDEHLKEGEKVAAVENRIYQIKNSNNSYFFYLDGWEARQLYNITDPAMMLQFLQKENVKYILDVAWARTHGHFDILPLTEFLGSVYFPKIVDYSGNPDIYNVGPVENPITKDSSTLVSINQAGWSEPKLVDGYSTQSVIAGNDSSRLLVATPNLTRVTITYEDIGKDSLSINLHNPYSKNWTNGYAVIQKTNTGKWKTFEFLAPLIEEGAAELAFHSFTENFTISKIEAAPFQAQGKFTPHSLGSEMTNSTNPPTLMAYLPILHPNETVSVQTNSFGKEVCVEVFEGVIQPWETTHWWGNHQLVVRSPNSTILGRVNPSLVWNATESGLCTVVVVSREEGAQNTPVSLQISGGGNLLSQG
jgi:Dolichyl-phosphate-mannose-protein mannosyltransferase